LTVPQKTHLRPIKLEELDDLYKQRIESDFPSAERPPLAGLRYQYTAGLQDILLLHTAERDVAYAVCAQENGVALISLLAVFKEKRGGGCGTALLGRLKAHYGHLRAILIEVEDPARAANAADRKTREKRIAFYQRAGYRFLEGIDHVCFGVPLLPMALALTEPLQSVRKTAVRDLEALYRKILPKHLWGQVVTRE